MSLTRSLVVAGVAAVLCGGAAPAFAQRHGGGGGHSRGASPSGSGSRGAARAAAPRSGPQSPGSASAGGRVVGVRTAPRYYSRVAPVRFYRPYYNFRPRVSLGVGLWAGYPFAYSYPFYSPFYYPYGYDPYGYVDPSFYSPYGYTTPNGNNPPNGYNTPNGYPPYGAPGTTSPQYRSGSGYPPASSPLPGQQDPQNAIGVQPPSQADTGGVSFEITPNTAQLFVDGTLVGTVGQFTPTSQPLGLAAGSHKIEVRAPDYQTMSFDVDIVAGEVIPYQGAMER
jgi:hypothetical protein